MPRKPHPESPLGCPSATGGASRKLGREVPDCEVVPYEAYITAVRRGDMYLHELCEIDKIFEQLGFGADDRFGTTATGVREIADRMLSAEGGKHEYINRLIGLLGDWKRIAAACGNMSRDQFEIEQELRKIDEPLTITPKDGE